MASDKTAGLDMFDRKPNDKGKTLLPQKTAYLGTKGRKKKYCMPQKEEHTDCLSKSRSIL